VLLLQHPRDFIGMDLLHQVPVEALYDLRGFSFFHAAREDYLLELTQTITRERFVGDRVALESLCERLKADDGLFRELAVKGMQDLGRYMVMTAVELGNLRRRMARTIIMHDDDDDNHEIAGMQESISRLDRQLFDLVRRRNRVIEKAVEIGIVPDCSPIDEEYSSHRLMRTVMLFAQADEDRHA